MAHRDTHSHSGTLKSHSTSSNIKINRICEFCKNVFTARTKKTLYCSLKCSSRAYKARTRQSKIAESDRQTEIARKPDLEIVKTNGISRRTIYRIISREELDIAKFGTSLELKNSSSSSSKTNILSVRTIIKTISPE